MNRSLFQKLNKDKKFRQRAVLVLCLALVCAALLVFLHMRSVGVAMTDPVCCGKTEHIHGENCVAEQVLMCENSEHEHTDACYRTVWSCGLEEHTHTLECYSDHNADTETPEIWEAALPDISGHPVSDIVRIAESQKGYTESSRNVAFTDPGNGIYEMYGYTRYGAFVNDPYLENWSAAFVSFCLHYAGMDETAAPRDTNCETMRRLWEDAGVFFAPDAHNAQPGDVVFIDRSGSGTADSIGVVSYASAEYIRVIEGSSHDKVEENEISLAEGTVLGYGVPVITGTPAGDIDTASAPDGGETQYKQSNETSGSSWLYSGRKFLRQARKNTSGLRSEVTGDVPLDSYITDITASGTTRIDETHFLTMVELAFTVSPSFVWDLTESGYGFVFNLPEEVMLLDSIIEDGPYAAYKIDSNPLEVAFTYNFEPVGDGTYRLVIHFDETYAQEAMESGSEFILNALRFKCYINMSDSSEENGLDIQFTVDKTLHIPPDEINENFDVSVQKTGSFTADGKLRYEVTVGSVNGTPSDIDITDTFTYSGDGTVSPPAAASVVKHNADGTTETFQVSLDGHVTSTSQNVYDLSMSLPQLDDNEYYTVVYEYTVSGLTQEDAAVSAYNSIAANSSDEHESTSDSADYFIYKQQRKKLDKDGIEYGDYVQWHISVNERGGDIAGKTLYDDGFADARNETINGTNGIVVQKGWAEAVPGVDYEFVYDANNEICGIRFLPADGSTPNNNTYHVTYYTLPDVAYGETVTVHNDAEFDGDGASYDVGVTGGDFGKTENGDESIGNNLHTINWTVNVVVPSGGIPAGTQFTDTLSPEGHYMTQAQYDALVTALVAAWGPDVSVVPEYTNGAITGYTFTVGTEGNGYLFADGYIDEIEWHYQTTGDMSGKTTETFVNTFSDGEKTLTVNNTVSPHVKKLNARKINDWQTIFTQEPTSLEFDYDDEEDKTFVWIAEVTPTSDVWQFRVTDTLPEGVELIGIKVMPFPLTAYNYGINDFTNNNLTIAPDGTLSGEIGQLWLSKTLASGSVTTAPDGRQVVDVILTKNSSSSDLFNNKFYVIYYCQLTEDVWPENGTVHLDLNNTLSVTADGEEYGEAENEILIDATHMEDVVGKAGYWDKNTHLITYVIDINPTAENLLTSSGGTLDPEWLSFTDVLTYTARQGSGVGEAILSLNTVTLEKEENGVWTVLPDIQWIAHTVTDQNDPNVKNAIIEMRIPDSTHLRLTYSYHINSSMADGITLENSASVEGRAEESGDHETHIEVEDFDTSGESTFEEFNLIKIDQESGRPLSGAVFTVYCWDEVNRAWAPTEKTYTTDNEGKIVIKQTDEYANGTRVYAKNTAYCIMETTAPPGYLLPENPRPFYFWFSDHVTAPQSAPDDFMLTAADISTASYRVEAENLCIQDVPETGIYGTNLLSSCAAALAAGVGTCMIVLKTVRKKKRYSTGA